MADPEGARIDHAPVTLSGEEGEQVAHNLRNLALGQMTVEQAGPAFGFNGSAVRIKVDQESFDALKAMTRGAKEQEA